jgi:hypothetical protein
VISIIDVSTFVEILNGKGKEVLKALQTEKIKGACARYPVLMLENMNKMPLILAS